MKISYHKISDSTIINVDKEITPDKWIDEIDWVSIKGNDREEVVKLMGNLPFMTNLEGYIEHPHKFIFPLISKEVVALNLIVSKNDKFFTSDYVTIILVGPLVITIFPEWLDLKKGREYSKFMAPKVKNIKHHTFFSLAYEMLVQSVDHIMKARNQLRRLGNRFTIEPDEIKATEVIGVRNNIVQLSDIVEDQVVGIEILLAVTEARHEPENADSIRGLIGDFDSTKKAADRLEEKAEAIRVQYMLLQQEKSNKKINVLTIVQALFVPLTFIAGVYGMNFEHMPELSWEYGYFGIWGIFVLIWVISLAFFYKHGWFD